MREIDLETVPLPSRDEEATHATRSLDAVYRAHAALVSRWIERLDPQGDTEDLLHDVFVVVQRRLHEFRGDASITTFLYAVTLRVVTGARRKRRLRQVLLSAFSPVLREGQKDQRTPEGALTRDRAATMLYELLDELGERDRTLLILFELEELPGREIAELLGMPERNLWAALHRARERLRRAYVARYGEQGDSP